MYVGRMHKNFIGDWIVDFVVAPLDEQHFSYRAA